MVGMTETSLYLLVIKIIIYMKKIIISLLLILGFYFSYLYIWFWDTIVSKQDFVINKSETLNSLPKKLKLNVNTYIYKIWLKLNYPNYKLLAWSYSINNNIILSELFEKTLKNPESKDIKITILPGWNIFDIDWYLAKNGILKSGELIKYSQNIDDKLTQKYSFLWNTKTLEWFLYPDTYRISPDADVTKIIEIMLDEFDTKIAKWNKLNYDDIIMTSIVEREEKNTENKPIVAGILKKRLAENIAIWADATVCYEYKLTQEKCTPTFIWEKIYQKTSYNTRNKLGLPPTPISNFSQDTYEATINSGSSPYYYYLHDNSWEIHYGRTLEEHNQNKLKYLN